MPLVVRPCAVVSQQAGELVLGSPGGGHDLVSRNRPAEEEALDACVVNLHQAQLMFAVWGMAVHGLCLRMLTVT